jgi:hypothetical protein
MRFSTVGPSCQRRCCQRRYRDFNVLDIISRSRQVNLNVAYFAWLGASSRDDLEPIFHLQKSRSSGGDAAAAAAAKTVVVVIVILVLVLVVGSARKKSGFTLPIIEWLAKTLT